MRRMREGESRDVHAELSRFHDKEPFQWDQIDSWNS